MTSIIDGLFPPEIAEVSKFQIGDGNVEIDTAVQVVSFRCLLPFPEEDLARFMVWCVRPPSDAESATCPIVLPGGGRTIGYVFPVASFDPRSPYCPQNDQNRYLQIYSSVALLWLIADGGGNQHLKVAELNWNSDLSIADLFDSDLAIVVVGREVVDSETTDYIRLALEANGFFLADGPQSSFERFRQFSNRSVKAERFSAVIKQGILPVEKFLMLASRQDTPEASFLFYYQIVELLSDVALDRLMKKIISSAASASGYDLKTKVLDYTAESTRIAKLIEFARAEDARAVESLNLSGSALLSLCGQAIDDPNAAKVLYSVRNLIVHSQVALAKADWSAFRPVIDSLHEVVIAMLKGFPVGPHVLLDDLSSSEQVKRLRAKIGRAKMLCEENEQWFDRRIGQGNDEWLRAQVLASSAKMEQLETELRLLLES